MGVAQLLHRIGVPNAVEGGIMDVSHADVPGPVSGTRNDGAIPVNKE